MSGDGAALDRFEKGPLKVSEHRLANGLRVLLVERHADPVVTVMVWYKVGARNEREHEAGVSHFLEHMMFKGSERFAKGDIDRITTTLGGSNNAFTSADHTAYWFELASDRWEKALEIEADRMRGVLLDAREFDSERAVVLEELSMGLDDPWRRLSDLVQGVLFLRHPYRRPVIGHADALKRLSVDDMRDYHRRFYHPGNATVVVCGDIEPAEALARVEAHFGAIAPGAPYEAVDPFRPAEEPTTGERRVQVSWDDEARRLCIGWPSAPVGTRDDAALDVLSTLLTGGRLSRLHRRLVIDEELATSVSSFNDARVEGGVFWIFAECAQNADPRALEEALDSELDLLSREKVPARELARVRSLLEAAEAYDHETASDVAEQIGEAAVDAHWRLAFESLGHALSVDAQSLRECARRLLTRERRVVGWCLPAVSARKAAARRRIAASLRARKPRKSRKSRKSRNTRKGARS